LEDAGVIASSKLMVDNKVLGYKTMAFIGIYLDKASSNAEAVKELKKIPEVLECHYTTGNWSILIKIICRDNEHLMQLLNKKIQPIDGVSRTETFISLEQQIERQIQL
jgi:Lrp/AsnC family transcriptional regulator for asnA, asnC and gidA